MTLFIKKFQRHFSERKISDERYCTNYLYNNELLGVGIDEVRSVKV